MMIKKTWILLLSLFVLLFLSGCNKIDLEKINPRNDVYYELFVRSFADSNGDGIGDFKGISDKLDYLKDLGITGIWLMPIQPSPSYHGYDVTDYYDVNSDYGTLDDFKNLVAKADEYGIKIMLDMVFNHTSDNHPWFKAALQGDEKYKDYYNFATSQTNRNLLGSWGQGLWHVQEGQYYCGYFSSSMPDLNFVNPEVQDEIFNISKFWIDLGVDGFRLDAAQHYYGLNEYQDKSQEYYMDENNIFLQLLRNYCRSLNPDFYLTGEINVNAESIVSQYYRYIDSPLDFPVANRLVQTAQSNGSSTYTSVIKGIYDRYQTDNKKFISAPFLLNHDQDRLASMVNCDMNKMKLAAELLLSLPGTPIIYYGEELGMRGSKSNGEVSNGVAIWDETRRLPIPFGDEYTTTWFNDDSFGNVVENKHIPTANEQRNDPNSLYSTYKRMINVRNNNIALKYGNSFLPYENNDYKIQGFYREYEYEKLHQKVLVLHNLSSEEVSLPEYSGKIIYVSGMDKDFRDVTTIKAKSTIIIDVTGD